MLRSSIALLLLVSLALSAVFSAPRWLRDLGLASWLLVGVAALLFGLAWLLGATSAITQPVLAAFVVACVASPLVHWLNEGADVPQEIIDAAGFMERIKQPEASSAADKPRKSAEQIAAEAAAKAAAKTEATKPAESTTAADKPAETKADAPAPTQPAVAKTTKAPKPGELEKPCSNVEREKRRLVNSPTQRTSTYRGCQFDVNMWMEPLNFLSRNEFFRSAGGGA